MIQDANSGQNGTQNENQPNQPNQPNQQTEDGHLADNQAKQAPNDETVHNESDAETSKVKIEFPYSEFARAAVPKAFDVAETVATQWVNDQKFENLGLPNPIAEFAAVKALEKAKEVEKKLEEKGVITAAKMGLEIAKLQAQSFLQKWKK